MMLICFKRFDTFRRFSEIWVQELGPRVHEPWAVRRGSLGAFGQAFLRIKIILAKGSQTRLLATLAALRTRTRLQPRGKRKQCRKHK